MTDPTTPDAREDDAPHSHRYVHDEPWHPGEAERLGRRGFAERIAQTIGLRRDPAGLVVALYGAWGEGKTSVLEMVKEDLTQFPDVVVVEFNPWRFSNDDHLVEMFFGTLAERLGAAVRERTKRQPLRQRLRDAVRLRDVGRLHTRGEDLAKTLGAYGRLLKEIPGVKMVAKTADAVATHVGDASLEVLRARIESSLQQAELRPIIFIDDMDRLDGVEIRAVVRLVKLTAGFQNTTYVLAFDPAVVAGALSVATGGVVPEDGRRYLEKIVQVPLQLPAADQATLFLLLLEHLNDAIRDVEVSFDEDEQRAFVRYLEPLFEARRRTVRDGKRYANAVGFALPLLAGEVNVGDLLLLEAIRAWFPAVHQRVQEHHELFVGDALGRPLDGDGNRGNARSAAQAMWTTVVAGLNEAEESAVRGALEHLFPYVQLATRNTSHGVEWIERWDRGRRAASRNYFDRYFQYAVPKSDVSDRVMETLTVELNASHLGRAVAILQEQATPRAVSRLIEKLSPIASTLTAVAAETLARAIMQTGDQYPDAPGGLFGAWLSPEAMAARLVRRCVKQLPVSERVSLALTLVRTAGSLRFASATYSWFRALGTEREEGTAPLTEDEEAQVKHALAIRLDEEQQRRPLYRWEPAGERRALLEWWGLTCGAERTGAVLAARLNGAPEEATELLLPFRSHGWLMESGLPTPDMVSKHDYEAVARLVDPDLVVTGLRRLYGETVGAYGEYDSPLFSTVEEATAHQFARQHRLAKLAAAEQNTMATQQEAIGDAAGEEEEVE